MVAITCLEPKILASHGGIISLSALVAQGKMRAQEKGAGGF
jgi:hypothetical protein